MEGVVWDQTLTRMPPPYRGRCRHLLSGIHRGDPLVDALPMNELIAGAHHGLRVQTPEPEWVDWDSVRRGQEYWVKHTGCVHLSLLAMLLKGFVVGRFSDVLVLAGYTSSRFATYFRFFCTSMSVLDWASHPLTPSDPLSPARIAVSKVRCMHGLARRRCAETNLMHEGEGVGISQYDLAEVLLGFSVICLSIVEGEVGRAVSAQEKRDVVHMWRLIGWHLGIEDQYNVCVSVKAANEFMEDYMCWNAARFAHLRESTHEMQLACVEGFGMYTGIGRRWFRGLMASMDEVRGIRCRSTRIRASEPMKRIARATLQWAGTDFGNWVISGRLNFIAKSHRSNPRLVHTLAPIRRIASAVADTFVWPLICVLVWVWSFAQAVMSSLVRPAHAAEEVTNGVRAVAAGNEDVSESLGDAGGGRARGRQSSRRDKNML